MEIDKKSLLEGLNEEDVNSVITKYIEINTAGKELVKIADDLKLKVKIFMKEKKWNNYKADEDVSVSITRIEQQTIDKDKLKMILSTKQLESISKFKVVERMMISTKKQRDRMSRFVNG